MIKYFFFFLLFSCATAKLPTTAKVTEKNFSTAEEARHFVKNRLTYLRLLFEQSFDPYYNTPKWDPACLVANQIGKLQEKNGSLWFVSRLFLNENGDVGFCSGKMTEITLLHCPGEKKTYEIHCLPGECGHLSSQLCLN